MNFPFCFYDQLPRLDGNAHAIDVITHHTGTVALSAGSKYPSPWPLKLPESTPHQYENHAPMAQVWTVSGIAPATAVTHITALSTAPGITCSAADGRHLPCHPDASNPHVLWSLDDDTHAAGLVTQIRATHPIFHTAIPVADRRHGRFLKACIKNLYRRVAQTGLEADQSVLAIMNNLSEALALCTHPDASTMMLEYLMTQPFAALTSPESASTLRFCISHHSTVTQALREAPRAATEAEYTTVDDASTSPTHHFSFAGTPLVLVMCFHLVAAEAPEQNTRLAAARDQAKMLADGWMEKAADLGCHITRATTKPATAFAAAQGGANVLAFEAVA